MTDPITFLAIGISSCLAYAVFINWSWVRSTKRINNDWHARCNSIIDDCKKMNKDWAVHVKGVNESWSEVCEKQNKAWGEMVTKTHDQIETRYLTYTAKILKSSKREDSPLPSKGD